MPSELDRLPKFLNRVANIVERNTDKTIREVAVAVDGAVVIATPVDTGRARANWQTSVGVPITSTRAPYSDGADGSTAGTNARSAIDQCKAAVVGYKAGQTVYITNNLPYITPLNEGTSAQAPEGFVEKSVLKATATVKSARILKGI